jgi:hypothetical protein
MGPEKLNNLYDTRMVARLPSSGGACLAIPQVKMFEDLFDDLLILDE